MFIAVSLLFFFGLAVEHRGEAVKTLRQSVLALEGSLTAAKARVKTTNVTSGVGGSAVGPDARGAFNKDEGKLCSDGEIPPAGNASVSQSLSVPNDLVRLLSSGVALASGLCEMGLRCWHHNLASVYPEKATSTILLRPSLTRRCWVTRLPAFAGLASSRHQALERLQCKLEAAKEQLVVRTRRVLELEAIERQVNAIKMATKGDAVSDFLRSCVICLFLRWRNETGPTAKRATWPKRVTSRKTTSSLSSWASHQCQIAPESLP
jgi:hypothetical protein